MLSFGCTSCGICCSKVGKVVKDAREQVRKQNGKVSALIRDLAKFPYGWSESGTCEKLIDNKCSVYDKRPDVCSVERSWKLYSKETKEEYFKRSAHACNLMIDEAGLSDTFKVKL